MDSLPGRFVPKFEKVTDYVELTGAKINLKKGVLTDETFGRLVTWDKLYAVLTDGKDTGKGRKDNKAGALTRINNHFQYLITEGRKENPSFFQFIFDEKYYNGEYTYGQDQLRNFSFTMVCL